jgi:hypothetical protein
VKWGGTVVGTPTVSVHLVSRDEISSTWQVVGSAVYKGPGNYTVTVSVKDVDGSKLTSSSKTTFRVAAPLLAEETAGASSSLTQSVRSPDVAELTQTDLQPIVGEAVARWAAAGLDAAALAKLAQVQFVIDDLPGAYLGEATADRIYLDSDAAGWGWFLDPTPADDTEYGELAGSESLAARSDTAAANRIDLLTTVMHEMGHLVGYDDTVSDDLMDGVLPAGLRRRGNVDKVFAAIGRR